MTLEEKSTWSLAAVSVVAYATYVVVILTQADGAPLPEVAYQATLLWTIGGAVVVAILLNIAIQVTSDKDAPAKDQRDREIYRFGEYVGQAFVVIGAIAALILAMLEAAHFWIANAVYLAFVLSAVVGSAAKIVAYRRGLPTW